MYAYHEVNSDTVQSILKNGLKRSDRGDKGDYDDIVKTDNFLDDHCPAELKSLGLSRQNNLYAYVSHNQNVISITDGAEVPIDKFARNSNQAVLRLKLDPKKCFVSDLDTYDALKSAIKNHENQNALETLAKSYWNKVIRLDKFSIGIFRRPEIMVTYDLAASNIKRLT